MERIDSIGRQAIGESARCWRARLPLWRMAALAYLLAGPAFGDDADRARSIVTATCAACHGMDGNSVVPAFPKLAGRHPEYIVGELNKFVSGKRKSDIMAPITAGLDPDDFKPLGAYFGSQIATRGTVSDASAAEAGRKLYLEGNEQSGVPACEGCHGTDAQGGKRFPRLAGQHREYLIEQIYKFRTNARNATRVMREVSTRMTDAEIKAVAEFLTGL